jgi:hypothetical protein
LVVGALSYRPQLIRADDVPAPWNALTSLSADQREEISAIHVATEDRIAHNSATIAREITAMRQQQGVPKSNIEMEVAVEQRVMARVQRLLERRDIEGVLTTEQYDEARALFASLDQTVEILKFRRFSARQQNDLFCWAAAIQILYNYSGVAFDQQQIADDIKGDPNAATVRPQDLVRGVSRYRDRRGEWQAFAEYAPEPPASEFLIGLIDRNRMVLAELNHQHMVVIFQATFRESSSPERVAQAVTYYDPLANGDVVVPWSSALSDVTGWFYAYAVYGLPIF